MIVKKVIAGYFECVKQRISELRQKLKNIDKLSGIYNIEIRQYFFKCTELTVRCGLGLSCNNKARGGVVGIRTGNARGL